MIKKLILTLILATTCLNASERIYIDCDEMDSSQHDCFFIPDGNNLWLKTNTVYRDETGTYTLDTNLIHDRHNKQMVEQYWKCPYCHRYWPKGTPCQNPNCPSRYP